MVSGFRVFDCLVSFRNNLRRLPGKKLSSLKFEWLEPRCLLAVTDLGEIEGRVFVDLNFNGNYDSGEEIAGAAVQLFLDNGTTPGAFDPSDTEQSGAPVNSPATTDANGVYQFEGLASGTYFAVQPMQTVGARTLNQQVSSPLTVSGAGSNGTITVDTFATALGLISDNTVDSIPVTAFQDVAEALGGERDVEANVQTAGTALAQIAASELNFGQIASATSQFRVVYDGDDDSTMVNTSGLSQDLTDGGTNTHFLLTIDAQVAGDSATVTVQNTTMSATQTFSLTPGESTYCLPFEDFTGDSAVFQSAGAVTLAINSVVPNNDFGVSTFATLQPDIGTANFLNDAVADLRLTKTVDDSLPDLGQNVIFTLTLTNDGPDTATAVDVRDQLPVGLSFVSAMASQGVYDDTTGIWTVGDLINGETQTLQITVTVNATGTITNIAQVSAADQLDPDSTPDNDVADEDDQDDAMLATPEADLQLTKTVDNSTPNLLDNVTFTISLTNNGPQMATNVAVR
ncbi:MAG: DUF11 domain-containing protein, partial [Planctomycetales bacterium]|nr:DUF11 domain-containing protein [Planctomycetales bacterium]NIO35094.1 DUF11 domain-containing protein [Planctomycetales bacterium]NIO46884.1 DUF11 domain-containing protein [Planctomycetales bacterium]